MSVHTREWRDQRNGNAEIYLREPVSLLVLLIRVWASGYLQGMYDSKATASLKIPAQNDESGKMVPWWSLQGLKIAHQAREVSKAAQLVSVSLVVFTTYVTLGREGPCIYSMFHKLPKTLELFVSWVVTNLSSGCSESSELSASSLASPPCGTFSW